MCAFEGVLTDNLLPYSLPTTVVHVAASLARKVYMRQNIGVGTFSRQYGGRNKRKGTVPEHFARASRGIIRHILKQVKPWLSPAMCASSSIRSASISKEAAIVALARLDMN
jgi:hypothetical protein